MTAIARSTGQYFNQPVVKEGIKVAIGGVALISGLLGASKLYKIVIVESCQLLLVCSWLAVQ